MEVTVIALIVLGALNIVQMWMNLRLMQGKEAGLPAFASQLLIVVQQNQQQFIEALKDHAAKTPDKKDDQLAALIEKWLPTILERINQNAPPHEIKADVTVG